MRALLRQESDDGDESDDREESDESDESDDSIIDSRSESDLTESVSSGTDIEYESSTTNMSADSD